MKEEDKKVIVKLAHTAKISRQKGDRAMAEFIQYAKDNDITEDQIVFALERAGFSRLLAKVYAKRIKR